MKKSLSNIFYLALAGMICLSSCSTDEETPAPAITLVGTAPQTVTSQSTVSFTVEASAQEKIQQILITEKIGSSTETIHLKTTDFVSNTEDLFVFRYLVEATSGTIELNFSITDKQGKVSAISHTLTVDEGETALAFEKTGAIIANKIGADQSAWDLATNVRRAGTATDADLVNPSTLNNPWIKGWDGVRSTTFVKANSFVYDDATLESAVSAFSAGTASASVTNVAVGDIYVAKIKDGSNYAVIKVTVANDDIANSNTEKIEFTYKKVSENAGQ